MLIHRFTVTTQNATDRPLVWRTRTAPIIAWAIVFCSVMQTPLVAQAPQPVGTVVEQAGTACPTDSLWLLSTRHLTSQAHCVDLTAPDFRIYRLDACGRSMPATLDAFLHENHPTAVDLIYIHGNRMPADQVVQRAMFVYRHVIRHRPPGAPPIRFLIWSWPSEQQGLALRDVRIKADRTDGQALYLAWLLREQVRHQRTQTVIGFSFGGRVATGALHALAGGIVDHRQLPGEHLRGAGIGVGLLAPAIGADWLMPGRTHGLATQNMSHLLLLYNRRDAVLKRYPLLDPASGVEALGFEGPRNFGPRHDGSPLPVFKMNCSDTVGLRHNEKVYYTGRCQAGLRIHSMLTRTEF